MRVLVLILVLLAALPAPADVIATISEQKQSEYWSLDPAILERSSNVELDEDSAGIGEETTWRSYAVFDGHRGRSRLRGPPIARRGAG